MSLTHQHKPRVTEDFFTPPNKQSYVEYKQTTKTVTQNGSVNSHPTASTAVEPSIDFDMSELDDLMNYDPNSSPAPRKKISEAKNTTEVASDLMDQLQSLEDEMKINFSSIENAVQESLRSSNSSVNSKSSGMYATVQKKTPTTSVSSVPGMLFRYVLYREVFHFLLSYVISAIMEEYIRIRRGDSLCNSNVFYHNGGNYLT